MDSGSDASDMRASLTAAAAALPRPALSAAPPRRSLSSRLLARKPLGVILAEEEDGGGEGGHGLEKELGLVDLLAIGIGGTVGSGVFVLTGQIAREYSGPAVLLSWAIAGVGCVLSGLSYAEMSARIPSAGSCYAYSYFALGELPAYVASWLLTLEYAVSGAAVARSWGDKTFYWVKSLGGGEQDWMNYEYFSVMAGLVQVCCVAMLLRGLSLGKAFVNVVTCTKVCLVLFMIVGGLSVYRAENLDSAQCTAATCRRFAEKADFPGGPAEWEAAGCANAPAQTPGGAGAGWGGGFLPERHGGSFGWDGVLRGATAAFFGFIGFDEVCCMAAQAKDSARTMPRAVLGTIAGTTLLSMGAAFALVGMACYTTIDGSNGFGSAFELRGMKWAEQVVEAGEIATLPVVVLVSFLAQPQLQFAMATDGLLPPIFKATDENRSLYWSTLLTGCVATAISLCVPFTYLNDMISAGVLICFNMTNAALLVTRSQRALQVAPGKAARPDTIASARAQSAMLGSTAEEAGGGAMLGSTAEEAGGGGDSEEEQEEEEEEGGSFAEKGRQGSEASFGSLRAAGREGSELGARVGEEEAARAAAACAAGGGGGVCGEEGALRALLPDGMLGGERGAAGGALTLVGGWLRDPGGSARSIMLFYNVAAMFFALVWQRAYLSPGDGGGDGLGGDGVRIPLLAASALLLAAMFALVRRAVASGRAPPGEEDDADDADDEGLFRAPLVPLIPCVATVFNCFLLSQFELQAWLITLGYVLLCVASYFAYGFQHSVGGATGWEGGALEVSPGAVRTMAGGIARVRDRSSFVPESELTREASGVIRVSGRLGNSGAIRVNSRSLHGAHEV